jgi:hypothetical protein
MLAEVRQSMDRMADSVAKLKRQRAAAGAPEPATHPLPDRASPAMRQPLNLQASPWFGPGEEAARAIAERLDYDFRVEGTRPPTATLIRLDAQDEAAWHVLQELDADMRGRAAVHVNDRTQTIKLVYPNAKTHHQRRRDAHDRAAEAPDGPETNPAAASAEPTDLTGGAQPQ